MVKKEVLIKEVPIKIGRRKHTLKIVKIKIKPGRFYYFNGFLDGEYIGHVRILGRNGRYETHSSILDIKYRNKGIGIELYSAAIEFCNRYNLEISSTKSPSDCAKRLWRSKRLRDRFVIRRKDKRWVATKRKRPRRKFT